MNLKWLLFSFKGRIGRQTYWFASLASWRRPIFGMLVDVSARTPAALSSCLLVISSLHEHRGRASAGTTGTNPWWSLIALIPIVGSIWC
jgi:uncharacterized membrane protein YhaH (DUF805 family)